MFTFTNKINIPAILEEILKELKSIGALPILVGGCVRDSLLNIPNKDYDIELFNLDNLEKIQNTLSKFGTVKEVGKSFGVLILSVENYDFDFALARVERKINLGHRGFEITTDSSLSFNQASLRRDFTINSIGYNYFTKQFLDPNNGIEDLKNKKLRHIKDETFVEDPLRVYRAAQFASRFDLELDSKTFELCKQMVKKDELLELPKQRIFEELKKMFLKSKKPSKGFEVLKALGVLKHFPNFNL